jgi:putative protease
LKRLPELLAPAGSPEALRAAVAAGADAVYLSGKRFGARKFAANFEEPQLREAIDYAHLHGVKAYVTVNTLIREDELADVAAYLIRLYEMGADAVLVQDVGIAALARRLVPGLHLHASTQMTIYNQEGVDWASRMGFERVVLAREVSLEEIKGMRQETGGQPVGLEVFVHGALCYSYSGQCLLSSAIGGRSGNRGMCAQPCRKPYVLLRGQKDEYGRPTSLAAVPLKEKFLISTRDLSVYRHLDKIVRSPIQSLKIEGRMKSAEYVVVVTSIYRKALDEIASGSWSPSPEEERDLALAFNRDFTEGYLLGIKDIMGRKMSDNRGVLIGSVASFDPQRSEAAVRLSGPLAPEPGDGLVFIAPGQEMGLVAQRPFQKDGLLRLRTPERVRPGAKVYLTGCRALDQKAQKIISSFKKEIPIDLSVTWENGVPAIEGFLENGMRVKVSGSKAEKAEKQPTTALQIESQIRRTGGTPFVVRAVDMSYPGDLFMPIGALNQLRRDLMAKAKEALIQIHRPDLEAVAKARKKLQCLNLSAAASPESRIPDLAVYADIVDAVRAAAEGGCKRIYFEPPLKEQKDGIGKAMDLLHAANEACGDAELIWKWPKITKGSFFEFAKPVLSEIEVDGIMVESLGSVKAILEAKNNAVLYGAASLNVWNHLTIEQLSPPFHYLTLSPELSGEQLRVTVAKARDKASEHSDSSKLELVVQGNLEVMITEDCIPCLAKDGTSGDFWGLQDFRRIFPLRRDEHNRTHIFNSAETCLLNYLPQIVRMGMDGVAVDARGRTAKYAREMTEVYLKAIDLVKRGGLELDRDLWALKEEARARSLGGITTGHFLKGLKEEIS